MTKLLDTTIRDGSYVIDFQFDVKDVATIAKGLDEAGVPFIEVGHGLGLNAGTRENMRSYHSDEEFFKAVSAVVKKGKWGTFFIPGIGTLEDIDLAAKYNMDFIRIGTNVTEVVKAEEYIKRAKQYDMYVAANFMKTYAISDKEVAQQALLAESFGADIVCIVDSAGGMFPEDVERYFNRIREVSQIPIGFHGHNNLGLGTANTLKAVELGCEIVDTSIRGMGRSAGNAVTEICLLALKRKNIDLGIDITKILDIAENIIDPLVSSYQQIDSIGVVSGFAQFHSSYLSKVLKYAKKHHVDPRLLIISVSEKDRVSPSDELIEQEAIDLKQSTVHEIEEVDISLPEEQVGGHEGIEQHVNAVAAKSNSMAKRFGKSSVLNIVQNYRGDESQMVSSIINDGPEFVIASAEITTGDELSEILSAANNNFDYYLIDQGDNSRHSGAISNLVYSTLEKNRILPYVDVDLWAKSVVQLCGASVGTYRERIKVKLVGEGHLAKGIRSGLESFLLYTMEDNIEDADLIVLATYISVLPENLKHGVVMIDALVGALSDESVTRLFEAGVKIYRPDMKNVVHSEVYSQVLLKDKIDNSVNLNVVEGIDLASGGMVAARGTVIVDNASSPKRVLGVAAGNGRLVKKHNLDEAMRSNIKRVDEYIAKKALVTK